MEIPLAGMIIGAIFGGFRARRKEGNGKDMFQWAAVHAMIFGVVGMLIFVILDRIYG